MSDNRFECGCERGGDCTRTTMCAVQDMAEEIERLTAYIQSAPRPVVDMSSDDVVLFLNDWMVWQDNDGN